MRAINAPGLLQGRRPTRDHQPATDLPCPRPAAWHEGDRGWFPRSLLTDSRMRCPTLSRQHRQRYAAGLPTGLPTGPFIPASELTGPQSQAPVTRCIAAHIHQVGAAASLTELRTSVPRVHLSASLAGPGPSGGAEPFRLCLDCSRPPQRSPGQAVHSFTGQLRLDGGGVLSPPLGDTAPRGAQMGPCRSWPAGCGRGRRAGRCRWHRR